MNGAALSKTSLVAVLILISSTLAIAQDWPQWRGANRDGRVTGFTAPQSWPKELAPKWKVTVGLGDASPALVGDCLYVFTRQGEDEVTLCLNAANGEKVWEDKYAAQVVTGPAGSHPGPRSSPAVSEGKVVTLGVGGVLSCLDASSGKVVWRKDEFPKVVPQFFTSMSPIIVDGMAIAHLGGPGNGALIAFDLSSGDTRWKWAAEGPEYASPVLLTVEGVKQIVTLTEKSIVGIGVTDGKLLWQLPFIPERRSYNSATPIVERPTVIYTGAARGTKAVKITKQGDGFVANEIWNNPGIAAQFSTPVLKDGLLYGCSNQGDLFCLNAQTGKTNWTDTNDHGSGSFAAIVDAGSVILVLPNNSELTVFKPNEKEYVEVARIKSAETPTYATPVASGNRIFIKDQDSLAMMMVE